MDGLSPSEADRRRRDREDDRYLETIVSIKEAARLASVSADTLRRHHRGKFIQLSPRRVGMRVRDALMLSAST